MGSFCCSLWSGERSRAKLVPAFLATFTVLYNQHRARCKLSNSLKYRQRRGGIAKPEEQVQRDGIDFRSGIPCGKNSTNFRSKGELAVINLIVNEFDSHSITRQDQALVNHVPYGQTEHAI